MQRYAGVELATWFDKEYRKPIVIRGARQVGKTWLVRHFCQQRKLKLIEFNFERRPEYKSLFGSNDPQLILENIATALNETIQPEKSLLFLDEIQSAPELLAKLRWFAEECPQLAVVAAGSLLEFILADHEFSMPVGRIEYLHLEPLSFEEFILAEGHNKLLEFIQKFTLTSSIPELIHQQLINLLKEYVIIGGMPEVVAAWVSNRSLNEVNAKHHNLIATYRDDFARYAGKVPKERLEDIINGVPRILGQKFMYSKINKDVQAVSLKRALHLLCKARLCHAISACEANGLPLGSGVKEKIFKIILLDCGLVSALLGLSLHGITQLDNLELNNKGGISEQLVGQLLRTIEPVYIEPKLFYWVREEKSSAAEIDYIIQHGSSIIPIEVKAGSAGKLRSLHNFMALKNLKWAVRISADYPDLKEIKLDTQISKKTNYKLLSIPFYLTGQLHRLLEESINSG